MQCANCTRAAIYIYAPRQITPSAYCERHLPSFLRGQARAGLLETTPAFDDARASALAKLATPQETQPEPQPTPEPVAQPEVTESPAAEEKPKRKRRAPRKKTEAGAEETAEA